MKATLPNCAGCPGLKWDGYVPEWVGANYQPGGVMLVGEAPGEEEAASGKPFVGGSGRWINQTLQRIGLSRDQFVIVNVLRSRPPNNNIKHPDAWQAMAHCAPYLDAAIAKYKPGCIVALGDTALQRLAGISGITKARGYVHSTKYGWVVGTYHPAFILRGKFKLTSVWLHDIGRAIDIAANGWKYDEPPMLLDPTYPELEGWVEGYEAALARDPDLPLIFDIETPYKGEDEDALEEEDDDDRDRRDRSFIILRIGFSYGMGAHETVSLPWEAALLPLIRRLFATQGQLIAHNVKYDAPRIRANGFTIVGPVHDTMVIWHVLNSDLERGLGFVAPFFTKLPMWKHLSKQEPARYNGLDCYATAAIWFGCIAGLKKQGMWEAYRRHVQEVDPIHTDMSARGMPIDPEKRKEASQLLTRLMAEQDALVQAAVPRCLWPTSPKMGYTRTPKVITADMEQRAYPANVKVCQRCGGIVTAVKKHTKASTKKTLNPCAGAEVLVERVSVDRWVKVLPFVPSPKGILAYIAYRGHPIQFDKKKDGSRKPTTNEKALTTLSGKYPGDALYPILLRRRELEKIGGTYIGWWNEETGEIEGGMPVDEHNLIHTTFSYDASTLRFTSSGPNLQNLPRPE